MKLERYSIGGKVFILGEYAVLAGLPSVIATVEPRFELTVVDSDSNGEAFSAHPSSPLGRLETWARSTGLPPLKFQFRDSFQGEGGFGASTAQFAMACMAYFQRMESGSRRWTEAWGLYRELMTDSSGVVPSGADLVAQWQGGVVFFDPSDRHCLDLWPLFDWANLLVFSASHQTGRKMPTHQHLETLSKMGFPQANPSLVSSLEKCLIQGISGIRENHPHQLGKAMNDYADILRQSGLESPATRDDRQTLESLPGVLGVKGTGAFQSDALIVLLEAGTPERERIIETAVARDLRLVSDGLTCQMGISCQTL
jgi:mevalonate kinase